MGQPLLRAALSRSHQADIATARAAVKAARGLAQAAARAAADLAAAAARQPPPTSVILYGRFTQAGKARTAGGPSIRFTQGYVSSAWPIGPAGWLAFLEDSPGNTSRWERLSAWWSWSNTDVVRGGTRFSALSFLACDPDASLVCGAFGCGAAGVRRPRDGDRTGKARCRAHRLADFSSSDAAAC